MFLREMENCRALAQPNIVSLLEAGEKGGTYFYTMEYCSGGSVADLMQARGGPLSVEEACAIVLQALKGLEYAHQAEVPVVRQKDGTLDRSRGLVHRDLKPQNLLLSGRGPDPITKIGDYGLSKAFDLAGLVGRRVLATRLARRTSCHVNRSSISSMPNLKWTSGPSLPRCIFC